MQQRIITGGIGAFLMIYGMIYSPWTFGLLFLLITLRATKEFYTLVRIDEFSPLSTLGTLVAGLGFILSYGVASKHLPLVSLLCLLPFSTIIFFVKLYKKEAKPFTNIAFTFLGLVYVALPFSLLNVIAFKEGVFNYQIVAGCLFLLWASDTGAYFSGVYFGKTKLFERVSPKKTWEGSLGGLVLSLTIAFVLGSTFSSLPLWKWLTLSVLIVVAGTFGDLVESLFKRSINIKDSGSLLPGHGGLLDRFDGLLLASPYITVFLILTESYS